MSDEQSILKSEGGIADGSETRRKSWDPYEVWRTRILQPRLSVIPEPEPEPDAKTSESGGAPRKAAPAVG